MSDGNLVAYTPPGPVAARFHQSEARVRCILGPVGSGKSSSCVMEIIRHTIAQQPYAKMRRARWAIIRNCYDDETEVLTDKGWRLFKDLSAEDKVATLYDGKRLGFEKPSYYYSAPYKGEMVDFENEGVNFSVTPNHKMYVSKQRTRNKVWTDYELKFAQDIEGSISHRVKRDAEWQGESTHTPQFFEWLGFWFAEGCSNIYYSGEVKRYQCVIVQKKSENFEYIRNLFSEANLPITESVREDGCHIFRLQSNSDTKMLIRELSTCGKSTDKFLPSWVRNAPAEHLQAFIKGFLAGDGHKNYAYTSSKQLADDLQDVALRAGMVANISSRDRSQVKNETGHQQSCAEYTVTFVGKAKYQPTLKTQGYAKKYKGWSRREYDSMVYCVEVSTHVIYVRRRGKAFWCSQTYPELKSTTIKTFQQWVNGSVAPMKWDAPISAHLRIKDIGDGTGVDLEIIFIAIDSPNDTGKLRSLELTGAWVNEASELPKQVIDMVTQRVGRYPKKDQGGATSKFSVIMDTNPPDDDHWWYRLSEGEWPDGWEFFKQPGALLDDPDSENPDIIRYKPNPEAENILNISEGYDYYLKMVAGKTREWIKVFVQANYGTTADGKPVFPEYNDKMHVAEKPLEVLRNTPIYLGWDFGLTPACIIGQITPRGQLIILDELIADDMGIRNFANDIVKPLLANKYPNHRIISTCDPAGNQRAQTDEVTCQQELYFAGIATDLAPSNDFIQRREAVAYFLTRMTGDGPGILLDPSVKMLRKGFIGGYRFERVQASGERFKDRPCKDKFSHPHDALQYLCMGARGSSYRPRVRAVKDVSAAGWT